MTTVRWSRRPYLDKWSREGGGEMEQMLSWSSPIWGGGGSRADGGADARQAQGSFHFKDHPPRIHGSGGKRGRKQDSKATDLLLTDFFWNLDNLFRDQGLFTYDYETGFSPEKIIFPSFPRLGQLDTICKNAEVPAAQSSFPLGNILLGHFCHKFEKMFPDFTSNSRKQYIFVFKGQSMPPCLEIWHWCNPPLWREQMLI